MKELSLNSIYCFKCKKKFESNNSKKRSYGHRVVKQKVCSKCGTLMTSIIKGAEEILNNKEENYE